MPSGSHNTVNDHNNVIAKGVTAKGLPTGEGKSEVLIHHLKTGVRLLGGDSRKV
jgi:hypothetical protein